MTVVVTCRSCGHEVEIDRTTVVAGTWMTACPACHPPSQADAAARILDMPMAAVHEVLARGLHQPGPPVCGSDVQATTASAQDMDDVVDVHEVLPGWRCHGCGALLLRGIAGPGTRIEIRCRRCRTVNMLTARRTNAPPSPSS